MVKLEGGVSEVGTDVLKHISFMCIYHAGHPRTTTACSTSRGREKMNQEDTGKK